MKDLTKTYRLEKDAQSAILKHLNSLPGYSFDRTPTGTHGNTGGMADITGCVSGHAVYIEVKSATGKVSKLQENFLKKKMAAGASAGVARSIQDALDICSGTRKGNRT